MFSVFCVWDCRVAVVAFFQSTRGLLNYYFDGVLFFFFFFFFFLLKRSAFNSVSVLVEILGMVL